MPSTPSENPIPSDDKYQTFDIVATRAYALALGFFELEVANFDALPAAKTKLDQWLAAGMAGDMSYMQRNAALRADPSLLLDGAQSVILVRMNYLPQGLASLDQAAAQNNTPLAANVSVYAHGRDYHTVLRQRLQKLVLHLQTQYPDAGFRVFTDSAPVMEVALAASAGLGWRGKHSLLIHRDSGSFFFLGGILTSLKLESSPPQPEHCGSCTACITVCPTQAITAPYVVDARRCISYLTIEHQGAIDEALRPLIGNKIYGCDDCQTACPWNKFAQTASLPDFAVRNDLDSAALLNLWAWSETEFLARTQGSAIRRIGHARWLRNIATALGNALRGADHEIAAQMTSALQSQSAHENDSVREHVGWALKQAPSRLKHRV